MDEIEKFIKSFINLSFELDTDNEVIYINDDQDFLEKVKGFEEYNAVSIHVNESFSRLYVTLENKITYVVRLNKVSTNIINSFISKDRPVKYALNSFSFVKWCNQKSIDLRNIYDIPTYIKLLTNNVDLYMSVNDYINKYSKEKFLSDDNEYNEILIGNFILEFGKYLDEYAQKFNLEGVCKSINENSYFEGAMAKKEEELSKIVFSYDNINTHVKDAIKQKEEEYKNRAYVRSPLGRIALKFDRKLDELIFELYNEDLEMMILNELYNNNIKVTLLEENLYEVTCKYKNLANVITLLTAVLNDVFFSMFQSKIDIRLECLVKE